MDRKERRLKLHPLAALLIVPLLAVSGCGAAASRPSASPVNTDVQRPEFSLTLPGQWTEKSARPGLTQFVRSDGGLSACVSVFNQTGSSLESYLTARLDSERESAKTTTLAAPVFGRQGAYRTVRYSGQDSSNGRRVASVIYFRKSLLVQLYLEGYVGRSEFDRIWSAIDQSLRLQP
jgi:hypothetical protein